MRFAIQTNANKSLEIDIHTAAIGYSNFTGF